MLLARQIVINLGIAVVLPMLIYYGSSSFGAEPARVWEQYGVYSTSMPTSSKTSAFNVITPSTSPTGKPKGRSACLIIIPSILGCGAIVAGAARRGLGVNSGLSLGGIASISLGFVYYSTFASNWIKFLALLIGMIVLLVVGYRIQSWNNTIRPELKE